MSVDVYSYVCVCACMLVCMWITLCAGGGKSSCVKLLERFYVPDDGRILLDGSAMLLIDWCAHCGMIE